MSDQQQLPEPKPGEVGSIVNINCRFKREGTSECICDGKRAKIVFKQNRSTQFAASGQLVRYECLTCGGAFFIGT